eukprot:9339056-Alexandrium_andersonii.AAC.1
MPSGQLHPRLLHTPTSPAQTVPAPILAGRGCTQSSWPFAESDDDSILIAVTHSAEQRWR